MRRRSLAGISMSGCVVFGSFAPRKCSDWSSLVVTAHWLWFRFLHCTYRDPMATHRLVGWATHTHRRGILHKVKARGALEGCAFGFGKSSTQIHLPYYLVFKINFLIRLYLLSCIELRQDKAGNQSFVSPKLFLKSLQLHLAKQHVVILDNAPSVLVSPSINQK